MFKQRMHKFQSRLQQSGIELAVVSDDDSVYYLCGYYNYLHMSFGRPTLLLVSASGESLLITPAIDLRTAEKSARVNRIVPWNDGEDMEWRGELKTQLSAVDGNVGIEADHIQQPVLRFITALLTSNGLVDITPQLAALRMVKSPDELQLARHAGEVGVAMMTAGRAAIADGVKEFEVALATSEAGTRKAADLLSQHYDDDDMSPNIHFLQIMASGDTITRTHHRASNRTMNYGEPVFLCFCGMTNFHRFKLGFDRTFWIGECADSTQAQLYQLAVDSQRAALAQLKPGVTAESVHKAYATVITEAGYEYPFRCGRATGFSYLETPQLVTGDTTVLQPGMVLAVDGSVSGNTFRAQVGDSFIITDDGYEQLTPYPNAIDAMCV